MAHKRLANISDEVAQAKGFVLLSALLGELPLESYFTYNIAFGNKAPITTV